MDPHLRRDPQYQNFVTVFRGFAYVGTVLEPYTKAGLRRAHQKAYRAAAGHPPCYQQCSRLYGNVTIRWCAACKTWKNTLVQNRRGQFRNWENTKSWDWPGDYETIASVYLPSFWNMDDVQLKEFGTACHIWTSCEEFDISNGLLRRLREFRNKDFGHNADLKVADAEKTRVFDALKSLIRDNDVQASINTGQCIQELDRIAAGDELKDWVDEINERFDESNELLEAHANRQAAFDICLAVCLSKVHKDTVRQNEILGAINNKLKTILTINVALVLLALIVVAYIVFAKPQFTSLLDKSAIWKYSNNEECFSEMYIHPFPQDLPLLPYLNEHSELFGRNWLFRDMREHFQNTKPSDKGVLITADMGYGKSAIVKHLLCAGKDSEAYEIRSRIVAFHVCRFDVPSTKDPLRFIKRLVGFFSTKFPEFGGMISDLPDIALLYDDEKCKKEIEACFDQGVLHLLLNMKILGTDSKVIVIDAIDECFDKRTKENEMYNLLNARYRKMPKWIKFMITSRNISLIHNMVRLRVYRLDSGDQRNTADIKQYIQHKTSLHTHLLNVERTLETFLEQSEGNFLFINHLMDYFITNNEEPISKFPDTLSDVYGMNFERHFQSVDEYIVARSILEVIIASLRPLNKYELMRILENVNVSDLDTTDKNIDKMSFCFRSMQEITLVHQSFESWLLSSDSRQFRISIERGHAILSRYLFHQINQSRADIVDVAIHVGNANDPTLIKVFAVTYSSKNVTMSTLHQLVWKSDSEAALELIINLGVSVDILNEGNVTAAFVASARGRLNQLKLLKSKGANLSFVVNDSYLITSTEQIDDIKHNYFFGYGLIHIATQFGHLEISEFLIKHNKSLLHSANGLGLSAAEIACDKGRLNMLLFFINNKADVGRCHFYAARNGHTHIVNKLANLGVNVSCISETEAEKAFTKLFNNDKLKTVFSPPTGSGFRVFNLYDLWGIVFQQSPLHAAISFKFTDTADALIEFYPHLTECVNAFGMTPFLLSAFTNETRIFERLLERVKTDKCQRTLTYAEFIVDRPICPVGGNYVHLDGIYGRTDLTVILYRSNVDIDWLMPDNNSISPAHYAACNGNMLFLANIEYITNKPFSSIKSSNHSTPLHSAAICGSLSAMQQMTNGFKNKIPNVVDLENRTILHYTVLREMFGNPANLNAFEQSLSAGIFKKLFKIGMRIKSSDCYMRNVLHYALKNGHFLIVQDLCLKKQSQCTPLLKQKDINGSSPIDYAITEAELRIWNKVMFFPFNCSFYDIFFDHCGVVSIADYLNSWEVGLVKVLQTFTSDVANDFIGNLKTIILKSPYLTSAVLVYLKDMYALDRVQEQLIEIISRMPPRGSIWALARHNPKAFKACGKRLGVSPLHLMAYKLEFDTIVDDFVEAAKKSGLPFKITGIYCADRRGYNSFHYSLKGGNIYAALRLMSLNVAIKNRRVSFNDIPWMILLGQKRNIIVDSRYFACTDQLTCMDYLFHTILKKHVNRFEYSDFCLKKSVSLSPIHLMAANGLKDSITFLRKTYGLKIMKCQNKDRITPLYLWDLLNNKSSSETFQLTTKHVPYLATEELLLFGLITNFPLDILENNPMGCLWNKHSHLQRDLLKCLIKVRTQIIRTDACSCKGRFIMERINITQIFIPLMNAQLQFRNALFFQQGSIPNALVELKLRLSAYRACCKRMRLHFNYPRLNDLLLDNMNVCKLNGQTEIRLECMQVFSELQHLINKYFAFMRKYLIYDYIIGISSRCTLLNEYFEFIRNRIEKLSGNSRKIVLDYREFVLSNKHNGVIERHTYLNVLKKTVKYQHIKDKIRPPLLFDMPKLTPSEFDVSTNISKPFEDILNNLNSSSYSRLVKDLY